MIRGKSGFWLLVIVFAIIILVVVMNGENYGLPLMPEMDGTMGSMMKRDHAANYSIADVYKSVIGADSSHHAQTAQGHEQLPFPLKSIDLGSSAIILMLLPLMLGATALLIILWI